MNCKPVTADSESGYWVFYDGDCDFCCRCVALILPLFQPGRLKAAPLQDDWVRQSLKLTRPEDEAELLSEMCFAQLEAGRLIHVSGGVDAIVDLLKLLSDQKI